MLRPEGGDPGVEYVCTLGVPAGGVPRACGLRSSRVAGVPQCQTVGWPHEQGPLVSLCEASVGIQVEWGLGSLWGLWSQEAKLARMGERDQEGGSSKIWTPCQSEGSPGSPEGKRGDEGPQERVGGA